MDKNLSPTAGYHEADYQMLCHSIEALLPEMEDRAPMLDETSGFPCEDIAFLHAIGAMLAPFPEAAGGCGLGTSAEGTETLATVLRMLGRGHLAVGRLFEAHVNAIRLLARYAAPELVDRAAADVAAGQLIGLWVTDNHAAPLVGAQDGRLSGGKAFCSAAGHAAHAVVTARTACGETRLAYLSTRDAPVIPLAGRMHGMHAAKTAEVSFDGCRIDETDWFGKADDYLCEPEFSTGAWRTSAVTCGGLEALLDHAMHQLTRRGRERDPHQQARMGQAWIARETALMWLSRAAAAAELPDRGTTQDRVATVSFARIAIERACLETMTLVDRSLGLAAFVQPDPIERIRRDLATYLRQPAPDEVLTEAAAHILRRPVSAGSGVR